MVSNESVICLCETRLWVSKRLIVATLIYIITGVIQDHNLTWATSHPDLTPCFQRTVLSILPPLLFMMVTPFDLRHMMSKTSHPRSPLPWRWRNSTSLLLNLVLILMGCFSLGRALWTLFRAQVFILSRTFETGSDLVGFVSVFVFGLMCRSCRKRISLSLPVFWLLTAFVASLKLYSLSLSTELIAVDIALRVSYLIICLILTVTSNIPDPVDDFERLDEGEGAEKFCPLETSSLLSRITFAWCFRTVWIGLTEKLETDHLPRLCSYLTSEKCAKDFDEADHSINGQREAGTFTRHRYLFSVLAKISWPPYVCSLIVELIGISLGFLQPFAIGWLLDLVVSDEPKWHGVFYAMAYVLGAVGDQYLDTHQMYLSVLASMRAYSALASAIFRKVLRLSPASKREYTVGEITNLMSTDTDQVYEFIIFSSGIYSVPLKIAICLYLLYQHLHLSSLACLGVMAIMCPFSVFIGKKCDKYQFMRMKLKDKRIEKISEVLNGIKVLKLYAWEHPFIDRITGIRTEELAALRKMFYWDAGFAILWGMCPMILAGACFATYIIIDSSHSLDAKMVFVSLSLFNILRNPMGMLPDVFSRLIKAVVSMRRFNKFFNCEELDPISISNEIERGALSLSKASFGWDLTEKATLESLQLKVRKGALVAVVGRVGTGKSSLLSALMGDMYKMNGELHVNGSIAYVPQQAWIQNATLRNNIVFTAQYDETFYQKVIAACALGPDLEILPGKDLTEIGEKGVNLSGGQKQRVSLARACYQDADICLLDDPLSAVDAHVAHHLFQKVIGPNGMLKNKTRILATHHVSFLHESDLIVVMDKGEIVAQGTFDELSAKGLLDAVTKPQKEVTAANETTIRQISRSMSIRSNASSTGQDRPQSPNGRLMEMGDEDKGGNRLIETEEYEVGIVKWTVYWAYIKYMGLGVFLLTVVTHIAWNASEIGANYWLSQWTKSGQEISQTTGLSVYLSLIASEFVWVIVVSIAIFVGTLRASAKIHKQLLYSVLRSPLMFFDTTPMGRILNRFSSDISLVDSSIPFNFKFVIGIVTWNPIVFGLLAMVSWYLLLATLFLVVILFGFYKCYTWTSRQIKRIYSITRSPVYSNLTETIQGVGSIRAYQAQECFIQRSNERVDLNMKCEFHMIATNRWLEIYLTAIGSVLLFVTASIIVFDRENISPGVAGLVLAYALEIMYGTIWGVRVFSELENSMVSLERLREFISLRPEAVWESEDGMKPESDWPDSGRLHLENYSTSYRPELSPVLNNIELVINCGEKVGIVGRTGAGKSSFALSLFRIVEPTSGRIVIDGVNIMKIGLHDLRSKLTIIPQDPVLFSGTLRLNLDPWEEHSDDQLWSVLGEAHLKNHFEDMSEGLNHEINEGGDNLSSGQKQLVCLARALLRKTKILILDEATASVDMETDQLIQATIKEKFSDCTILTIAHRLHTIMDYDRVLVLSKGRVIEDGKPLSLLAVDGSQFSSLAKEAGIST